MTIMTRVHTKSKARKLEALTGIRVTSTVYLKRDGQKPLYIRSNVAEQNK